MTLPRRALIRKVRLLLVLVGMALPAWAGPAEDRQAALGLLGRGAAAFEVGDIVAATRDWSEAARLCRIAGLPQLEAEALARRGEAYRMEGHFREAANDMAAARDRARAAGDELLAAA